MLLTAQTDTYLRSLGSRVAERPAAEPPPLLAEWSLYSSVWRCLHCDSHVKVRLTETETEKEEEMRHGDRFSVSQRVVTEFCGTLSHVSCVSIAVVGQLPSHARTVIRPTQDKGFFLLCVESPSSWSTMIKSIECDHRVGAPLVFGIVHFPSILRRL